jgi:hypothetical protein
MRRGFDALAAGGSVSIPHGSWSLGLDDRVRVVGRDVIAIGVVSDEPVFRPLCRPISHALVAPE